MVDKTRKKETKITDNLNLLDHVDVFHQGNTYFVFLYVFNSWKEPVALAMNTV